LLPCFLGLPVVRMVGVGLCVWLYWVVYLLLMVAGLGLYPHQSCSCSGTDAEELLALFREAAGPSWLIDQRTFRGCLERFLGDGIGVWPVEDELDEVLGVSWREAAHISTMALWVGWVGVRETGDSVKQQTDAAALMDRLFTSFNKSSGPDLSMKDVLNAVFVLSGGNGDTDAHIRDVFDAWHGDETGFLNKNQAARYLNELYTVLDRKAPQAFNDNALRPCDLAGMTSARCLREGDLDNDGRLTYEEFRRWFVMA